MSIIYLITLSNILPSSGGLSLISQNFLGFDWNFSGEEVHTFFKTRQNPKTQTKN